MTALTASDLTITVVNKRSRDRGSDNLCKVVWSSGKTFPSGGIAITPAKFGYDSVIESAACVSSATGFTARFDSDIKKLIFQGSNLSPITSAATGSTLYFEAKGK